ncbi:MAG TPA: hypothetical protein VEB43_11065 [Anaeromyxobacter sp.]|nr:hypothetical protein [Anaeromyxobacter sp.]
MTGLPKTSMSKAHLLQVLARELRAAGYRPVPGSKTIVYKREDPLILTLGIEFSNRYKNRFSGSFYLGPTFEWGYMLRDLPRATYQRVGCFLTAEERHRLLDSAFTREGVVDAWWIGFTPNAVHSFVETVRTTEARFLAQPGLTPAIEASELMRAHVDIVRRTLEAATRQVEDPPSGLQHQPKHKMRDVSPEYYRAAELVLRQAEPSLISPDYVSLIAIDAWRMAVTGAAHAVAPR